MASHSAPIQSAPGRSRGFAHRIALAREPHPAGVARPSLRLLAGEASWLVAPVARLFRRGEMPVARQSRTVVLFPGFCAQPLHMRSLRRHLEAAGHRVHCWGLGFNAGPRADTLERLERRLDEIAADDAEPAVLIGWSLGGIFAREIAKLRPERVAKVVTMGSPFSGHPRANNAWRLYHLVTGHRVEEPPIDCVLHEKPPVETVALWSPRDGVVSPRAARGRAGERDRARAVRCTHMGFVHDPRALAAVLEELDLR